MLVFCENDFIKVINIHTLQVQTIAPGYTAAWSGNSRQLIYAQDIGGDRLGRLYRVDLKTHTKIFIRDQVKPAKLAWDSFRKKLYLFGPEEEIHCLDLTTGDLRNINLPKENTDKPFNFKVIHSSLVLDESTGKLLIGHVNDRDIRLLTINLKDETLDFDEEKLNFRYKSVAPLLINSDGSALLIPRIDGSFAYAATWYHFEKTHHHHDGDDDDHCEADHK
jgi:hypothetical protein